MLEWFWSLLSGAITLCQVAVGAGVLAVALGRWRFGELVGHVVTVVCGLTAVLGLTVLVALGAISRLGVFGGFISNSFPGPDDGEKARHLAEFLGCTLSGVANAGLTALLSSVLWMVARRRVKKMEVSSAP